MRRGERTGGAEEPREQDECLLAVPQSLHPAAPPFVVPLLRRGRFYCFYLMSGSSLVLGKRCLWCSSSLFPGEELHLFSFFFFFLLVYRILMILIIAIIINIIMIAIVTVNVVITGIIMKTCLFLLLLFSYVIIINDVTVFGFLLLLKQSDSTRTLASVFFFLLVCFSKRSYFCL